jgi:hypothetical protein
MVPLITIGHIDPPGISSFIEIQDHSNRVVSIKFCHDNAPSLYASASLGSFPSAFLIYSSPQDGWVHVRDVKKSDESLIIINHNMETGHREGLSEPTGL